MIEFDEAIRRIAAIENPLDCERIPLEQAAGRVLAESLVARINAPVADVSAMDGYAVRDVDVVCNSRFTVIGEAHPGSPFDGTVGEGDAVRIFTGAALPVGSDRVIVQEHVCRDGVFATLTERLGNGRHVRRRGSDFECGATLLTSGTLLTPGALVAAAAADVAILSVWRRPRVFIVSTGDELVPAGHAALRPGMVPESVSVGVAALTVAWGGEVVGRRHFMDDVDLMQCHDAEISMQADIVVVIGGSSVGERDHSCRMFERLGLEALFSKVAMKPGKPVWLARTGKTLIMGLPGNPGSALVTARLLLAPLLAGLSGRGAVAALHWRAAPLARPIAACGERETFLRATWRNDQVLLLSDQDSSAQSPLAEASLLVRRPANDEAQTAGQLASVIAF